MGLYPDPGFSKYTLSKLLEESNAVLLVVNPTALALIPDNGDDIEMVGVDVYLYPDSKTSTFWTAPFTNVVDAVAVRPIPETCRMDSKDLSVSIDSIFVFIL